MLLSTSSQALSVTAVVSLSTWGPVGPDPAVLVLERYSITSRVLCFEMNGPRRRKLYTETLRLQSEYFSYKPAAFSLKLISNILIAVEVYLLHYRADVVSHHVHSSLAQAG